MKDEERAARLKVIRQIRRWANKVELWDEKTDHILEASEFLEELLARLERLEKEGRQ